MTPQQEADLGAAMLAHARSEGHMGRKPNWKPGVEKPEVRPRRDTCRRLYAEGLTWKQIAQKARCTVATAKLDVWGGR